ncbi:MAG: hypothetical protein SVS15_01415 [Thermodesulfobacteriota bacterium]|nr:hypothetical protein [Thermodesulfobacteriota bacterium]
MKTAEYSVPNLSIHSRRRLWGCSWELGNVSTSHDERVSRISAGTDGDMDKATASRPPARLISISVRSST